MPTPAEIISTVAALQNDASQDVYTNAATVPYLNMAMRSLQEEFQLNDIPVTQETSALIECEAGVDLIGFATPQPVRLPADLIEIKQLWESPSGTNTWTPMSKVDFLPHYLENDTQITQFLIWAWNNQQIKLIASSADNDIKLDYIRSIFKTVTADNVGVDLGIINVQSYLEFKTAAYCSLFIGENESRALALDGEAGKALFRSLGISTKGRQLLSSRRRPFRASYKSRVVG